MTGEGGYRQLFFLLGAGLLATCLLILLLSSGTRRLAGGLRSRASARAANRALLKEARALDLTYEAALAAPADAVGKPAVWCLRKRGTGPAAYKGDALRPVYITNLAQMPDYAGSGHQTCTDALVVIGTFTALQFGEVRGVRLEAGFVAYP